VSIAIIINPVAGGARRDVARARAELAAATVEQQGETADIVVTERAGHARLLALAAVTRGARLVMAWGGDGTINEVAAALAFGEVPIGIIAAGSGNGLATDLGIDRRADRAIIDAMHATARRMDLGEIGGRLFANVAGIGFDAHVAACFNDPKNLRRGFVSYVRIATRSLLTYVPADYSIVIGDTTTTVRAVLIAVANSAQYGNGAQIAPGARVDDGELDLVVVQERSRFRTFCQTPRLFRGSIACAPGCSMFRITTGRIQSTEPIIYHVDGEPSRAGTDLAFCVRPAALKICVR
jgi:diacylglycerol kinase (ATP)